MFAAGHLHAVDAEVEVVLARLPGPLVTTSGQVISGAGSPGQQVWIGSGARSMSSPVQHDLLARRAARPSSGCIAITVLTQRQHVQRLAPAARRLRLLQERQRLADLAQLRCGSRSMPQATRSTVPNRLTSTGIS